MDDSLNPAQITTLCVVFVGFHLLAVPALIWAMRHRQFSGSEQRVWSLDDVDALSAIPTVHPVNTRRVRWMLAALLTMAAFMLSAIVLTLVMALAVPAHPAAAGAKCPFF